MIVLCSQYFSKLDIFYHGFFFLIIITFKNNMSTSSIDTIKKCPAKLWRNKNFQNIFLHNKIITITLFILSTTRIAWIFLWSELERFGCFTSGVFPLNFFVLNLNSTRNLIYFIFNLWLDIFELTSQNSIQSNY